MPFFARLSFPVALTIFAGATAVGVAVAVRLGQPLLVPFVIAGVLVFAVLFLREYVQRTPLERPATGAPVGEPEEFVDWVAEADRETRPQPPKEPEPAEPSGPGPEGGPGTVSQRDSAPTNVSDRSGSVPRL